MKLITAIIRPERIKSVQSALDALDLCQVTITDLWGRGHEQARKFIYRCSTFQEPRHQRVKLEIAVDDDAVPFAVDAICTNAKTGRVGDGVIWVTPVEEFIRIHTGQSTKRLASKNGATSHRCAKATTRRADYVGMGSLGAATNVTPGKIDF